jgi:pyocin large subunit-like protein
MKTNKEETIKQHWYYYGVGFNAKATRELAKSMSDYLNCGYRVKNNGNGDYSVYFSKNFSNEKLNEAYKYSKKKVKIL